MREDIVYTASEVGRRCPKPLSGARIKQLIRAGELKSLRTAGGVYLVTAAELERFLAERSARTEAE